MNVRIRFKLTKLERRTDMYRSTLRSDVGAMGGELEIIARFPNQAVRTTQFEALDPEGRPRRETRRRQEPIRESQDT